VSEIVNGMRRDVIHDLVDRFLPVRSYLKGKEVPTLYEECMQLFSLDLPLVDWVQEEHFDNPIMKQRLTQMVDDLHKQKEQQYGSDLMRMAEKNVLLRILNQAWKDQLYELEHLSQSVALRGYAQRIALSEYQKEALNMFRGMFDSLRETVTSALSHLSLDTSVDSNTMRQRLETEPSTENLQLIHPDLGGYDFELGLIRITEPFPSPFRTIVPRPVVQKPIPTRYAPRRSRKAKQNKLDQTTRGNASGDEECPSESGSENSLVDGD